MKRLFGFATFLIGISMLLCGCLGSSKDTDATSSNSSTGTKEIEITEVPSENTSEDNMDASLDAEVSDVTDTGITDSAGLDNSGVFTCIADFSDYWNDIYSTNEAVINAYEGMPILELVTPGLCFVTGVQYDLLNLDNKDGRYEGELMMAGYQGFVEKKGAMLTFGYDDTLEEDGFSPTMLAGDKKLENGACELDKGHYFADSYTLREDATINRSTSEFIKYSDGSMGAIVIEGSTLNYSNDEELSTSYIFILGGQQKYDFVVAESTVGTAYDVIPLKENLTKEEAITLFEKAGAAIVKSGGIKDGVLMLD